MYLAALIAVVLVTAVSPVRAAGFQQDSGSSSGAPAQSSPEKPQNSAKDAAPPANAEQKPSESNSNQPPATKRAATPGQPRSPSRPTTAVRKRHSRAHKPVASATADGEPRKIVVHQGGAGEPIAQIVPDVTQQEASRQRQDAEQLLTSTEADLKQLAARTLNPNQQEMVVQIRHYMDGARSALKDGDTQRAHTLALKAHLLSDDLVNY